MSPETVNAVKQALTPLADKLGQGANHLYGVYLRQAYNEAVGSLMWAVLLCGGLFALGFLAKKRSKYWEEGWLFWGIGVGIVFIVAGLTLTDGIQHLINPEYYAIHNIICDAKGGCGQ